MSPAAALSTRVRRPGHAPVATISLQAKVAPDLAGTPGRPQGVRLGLSLTLARGASPPPPVRELEVTFPVGNVYQGSSYPSCSEAVLGVRGPGGCPSGSLMGSGTALADAGAISIHVPIVLVNGGFDRVLFYMALDNPLRLQATAVGSIQRLGGAAAYRLTLAVPPALQAIAGIPLALRQLSLTAGRGDWLATTACPADHQWRYTARATFAKGQSATDTPIVACR